MAPNQNPNDATTYSESDQAQEYAKRKGSKFHQWLLNRLMASLNYPRFSIQLWDGSGISHDDDLFEVIIHNRKAFYLMLLHPDLYFGEGYMSGDIEVRGDLLQFLEEVYNGRTAAGPSTRIKLANAILSPTRRNSLRGSKRNIHHHYDIGNEFYKLWLDTEAMQYTCAYYPEPNASLETAQIAKLDHVCRKLQLRPGDTVVEAGCGWGGLARHMAKHYGVKVKAYNISKEQVKFAREKAEAMGLSDSVEYVLDDYRNIDGQFDVFVSVGMLEHVGVNNFKTLNEVIRRALKPEGRGLIHSIGRNHAGKMNAWIEKRIFPGAEPPSLKQMMDIFEDRLSVIDVENIRLHYAQTLIHWLERYEQNIDKVRESFDEEFIRCWRLYLTGSVAAFTTGNLQLFQVVFARAKDNNVPLTRSHLYHEQK